MNNPAENEICPYCGAPAVDITRMQDDERRWMCTGPICHEWHETDEIAEPEAEAPRPSLMQRILKKFSL